MKKVIVAVLFFLPLSIFAQYGSSSIKFGYFNPSATDGGFVIGYQGAKYFDADFNIGWSVDWFHKSYIDQKLVTEFTNFYGIPNSSINELRAKTNLHDIPFMFNVSMERYLAPRVKGYITAGAGLEVLLIFYRNFQKPDENEIKSAFDFGWQIGSGLQFQIGRRSDLLFELAYHSARPSWTYEVNDPTNNYKKILEREFNMSGIMARVGFKFYY